MGTLNPSRDGRRIEALEAFEQAMYREAEVPGRPPTRRRVLDALDSGTATIVPETDEEPSEKANPGIRNLMRYGSAIASLRSNWARHRIRIEARLSFGGRHG